MKRTVKRHDVVQPQDQSIKLIPLTRGYNAIIDAEDFQRVDEWHWFAIPSKKTKNIYAGRMSRYPNGTNRLILLHRFIKPCEKDIDHFDGNTLNNTKLNLRPCDDTQNGGNQKLAKNNKSGYKGVSWFKPMKKWICKIYFKNSQIHIGLFNDKVDAARAYDRAALRYFGEFARLNLPHPNQ